MSMCSKIFKYSVSCVAVACVMTVGSVFAADTQLIKTADNTAVYLVAQGARHAFPLRSIYQSWYGNDFGAVQIVSTDTLASYALGKNVLFHTGALIKIQTDPRVYRVYDDVGSIVWIPNEQEFLARGYSFKDVRDVPDSLFTDYTIRTEDYFATPTVTPPLTPTSTPTNIPTVVTSTPALVVSSPTITNTSVNGQAFAEFVFTTGVNATASLAYSDGVVTSTQALTSAASSFDFKVPVTPALPYTFIITATSADGTTATHAGSFLSYADMAVQAVTAAVPNLAPLGTPTTLVGAFRATNNSSSAREMSQVWLEFDTGNPALTTSVSKTVQIVRYAPASGIGDTVVERTSGSGVVITNQTNIQKFTLSDTIAPGETKTYGVVIKNLDQINFSSASPTDTLSTKLVSVGFLGDTSVYFPTDSLATLLFAKP